jgi:hypothetical protein
MRGIDRLIAVILLVGAVGGAAAFARHSGSDSTARSVHLAAPPLQHVGAPGTVLIDPTPALTRVKPAKVAPSRRVMLPKATPQRPVQPQRLPQPPAAQPPAPAATPVPAAPTPAQTPPAPDRALAAVQAAPASTDGKDKSKGHGHAWGHVKQQHVKQEDAAPAPEAPLAPTDPTVVPPPPVGSSGDEHGSGNGNGDGNEHGSGHDNGGPKHSGD